MSYTNVESAAIALLVELEEATKMGYSFPSRVIIAMNNLAVHVNKNTNIDHTNLVHLYRTVHNREVKPLSIVRTFSIVKGDDSGSTN